MIVRIEHIEDDYRSEQSEADRVDVTLLDANGNVAGGIEQFGRANRARLDRAYGKADS